METPAGDAVTISPGCLHNGRETQQFPRIIPRINQARKTAFLNPDKTNNFFKKADTKHGGRLNVNRLSLWGASQRTESRKRLGIFEYLNSLAFFFRLQGWMEAAQQQIQGSASRQAIGQRRWGRRRLGRAQNKDCHFQPFLSTSASRALLARISSTGKKKKIPEMARRDLSRNIPRFLRVFFFSSSVPRDGRDVLISSGRELLVFLTAVFRDFYGDHITNAPIFWLFPSSVYPKTSR